MKYIFSILLYVTLQTGFSQIIKTVGYSYTNGTPTYTPAKAGSALALDTVTWRYYTWNGSTWLSDGYRVQTISGCSAPAYTPTKFQSVLVINACTAGQGGPELYFWTGSVWLQINEGAALSQPANQVIVGTGTGTTSDSDNTYNPSTNVSRLNGQFGINTAPSSNYDFHIRSAHSGIAGRGGLLIDAVTGGYGFGSVITIKADSAGVQGRRYIFFEDAAGGVGWQTGVNEDGDYIFFSGPLGIHPILIDRLGDMQLNAGAAGKKIFFNNNPGSGTETEFYDGGLVPTKIVTFDSINGVLAWNGLPMRARSPNLSEYIEFKSDNSFGNITAGQPIRITSDQLMVTGSNTLPYTYGTSGAILNHYQSLSTPFHFFTDLVANPSGQFSNSNIRFWTQESGAVAVQRMIIDNLGSVGIGTASPAASAQVDITSTQRGFLPPRMTTTQRNAISSPATGLTLYCTDCTATDASTGVMQTYNGTTWKNNW